MMNIYFLPYVNSSSQQGEITGELVLPKDKYEFQINNGTLKIWGHDNVIKLNINAENCASVDIRKNSIDITSNNSDVVLLMSNIESAAILQRFIESNK